MLVRRMVGEAERTAYHEAGHFVVWHVLPCRALRIEAVTIADSDRYAGGLASQTSPWLAGGDLEDICVVLLAGYAAEFRRVGRPAPSHARTDLAQVTRFVRRLCRGDRAAEVRLRGELHGRCARALEAHWGRVERLAAALLERETLSRAAAIAAIEALQG